MWRETLRELRKTGSKTTPKSCFNLAKITPFYREFIEVRPRQANVLACVVFAGISEGLAGPRVLEGARFRCCSTG